MWLKIRRASTWLMAAALCLSALTACKTADLYRSGYDKTLTQESWANRAPDSAVVIIGGYRSVWQKADEPGSAFEARPRFKIDWTHSFDVALVKPGTYQLQTLVLPDGSFAEFGGFQGLGAKNDAAIASFQAGPGQVVYVGDLDAMIFPEGIGNCSANLSSGNAYAGVVGAFAKQVPYVAQQPAVNLMTISQPLVRFPCGQGG